ncbi:MAG TPA: hypothetical protein VN626_09055 [Clostridia bacterium]|nr:hypothetical protein [Clostridia bacterium]
MKKALIGAVPLLIFGLFFSYSIFVRPNSSESEQLQHFPALRWDAFMAGSFQTQFEQALKDQITIHEPAIEATVEMQALLRRAYNGAQHLAHPFDNWQSLTPWGTVYRMNDTDWLTGFPYRRDEQAVTSYQCKAAEINRFAQQHPSAKIYVYYCSRAEDMSWFDLAEQTSSFSYSRLLEQNLDENIRFDKMKFADFSEYTRLMYKTDHHWNNLGARKGYTDLLCMLSEDFPLGAACPIGYTQDFGALKWCGSRARESALSVEPSGMDDFVVDRYMLNTHRMFFGDNEMAIGLEQAYDAGEINRDPSFDQYLNYFGFESKPIRLEFPIRKYNLLIVGDSFARAVRQPLASHFSTTVFINFRILEQVDLSAMLDEYDINAVLFMGQQDAWSGYFLEKVQGDAP